MGKQNNPPKKFWDFRAAAEEGVGELVLYGPVSDTTWWGDEITPKQFAEDLAALGDIHTLNVYVNSYGGDVFAAHAIRSQLKRHQATVIAHIDGVAASAMTVILTGADKVIAPRNAMYLVHHPLNVLWGYYNAADMRAMAEDLDRVAESIIAAYEEKTGLDHDTISELMDNEEWMTAEEAKEWGFIDEVEETKAVAASLTGDIFNIGGLKMDISRFSNFPRERFDAKANRVKPITQNRAKVIDQKPVENIKQNSQEGDDESMDIKTVDELRQAFPDLVNQVENAATTAERNRIKGIEDISKNISADLVNKAKFEEPVDAKELAFKALQNNAALGKNYLDDAEKDAGESGSNDIKPDPEGETKDEVKVNSWKNAFATGAKAKRRDK